jgi:hypothetical protein
MPRNSNKSVKPLVVVPSQPLATTATVAPGLGQIVKEGMAFGAGSSIAHNIIGRMFGGPSTNQYDQCMELTKNNQEVCEHLR